MELVVDESRADWLRLVAQLLLVFLHNPESYGRVLRLLADEGEEEEPKGG